MLSGLGKSLFGQPTGVPQARSKRKRLWFADAGFSIVAIFIALIFFFPIYWAVSNSLRAPADTFTVTGLGVPFIDFAPTLENWISQMSVPEAYNAFGNSLVISICSVLIALALGLPAAYALARFRFKRIKNKDLTIWFLSQRVLPPVATAVPFFIVFSSLDMLDTHVRADPGQRHLHPALRGGDRAPDLPGSADRAGGGGAGGRRLALRRVLPGSDPARAAGDRGVGAHHVLGSPGTNICSR